MATWPKRCPRVSGIFLYSTCLWVNKMCSFLLRENERIVLLQFITISILSLIYVCKTIWPLLGPVPVRHAPKNKIHISIIIAFIIYSHTLECTRKKRNFFDLERKLLKLYFQQTAAATTTNIHIIDVYEGIHVLCGIYLSLMTTSRTCLHYTDVRLKS